MLAGVAGAAVVWSSPALPRRHATPYLNTIKLPGRQSRTHREQQLMASDESGAAKDYGGQDDVMKRPNLCMLALTPQQIHDRLTGRWSNQLVPTALMASVNLSLAFGSEYAGLTGSDEIGDVYRHVYLSASIVAFFLRVMMV
eukprot:COSAG06_NODE_25258_length_641_cov_0.950185_1_plen_141_part_10